MPSIASQTLLDENTINQILILKITGTPVSPVILFYSFATELVFSNSLPHYNEEIK
jgi:hypothetical protein